MPRRRQQARQPRPGFVPLLSQRVGFDYLQKLSVSLLLSLVLFAYKRSLVPLYASVPTQYTLEKTVLFTTIGVAFSPIWFSTNNILCGGVLLAAAPSTAYWLAAITARMRDPLWGPMITHALVLVPIVYFFTTIAIRGNVSTPYFRP
jgi:hypothetical protein